MARAQAAPEEATTLPEVRVISRAPRGLPIAIGATGGGSNYLGDWWNGLYVVANAVSSVLSTPITNPYVDFANPCHLCGSTPTANGTLGFNAPWRQLTVGDALLGAMTLIGPESAVLRPTTFYRGALPGRLPSFVPRPNEFKVDPKTGFVKDTHGVSVFDNAESVASKGFEAHVVDQSSIPDTLRIIQRGADPRHFEIVPKPGANLTPQQFIEACSSIVCVK